MAERKEIWHGSYTQIVVLAREGVSKNGFPVKWYAVKINGEELPCRINNISVNQGCLTVFEFSGTLFVGSDHKAQLTIFDYSNGVIQGEITVI